MLSEVLFEQVNHVLKNVSALCVCRNTSVGVRVLDYDSIMKV